MFGVDWNGPLPSESEDTGDVIEVPETFCPLGAADQQEFIASHCQPLVTIMVSICILQHSFVQEKVYT